MQSDSIYVSVGIVGLFYSFEQDSALAHRACKMDAFLDCKTPDFMSPCCLVLTNKHFLLANQIKLTIEVG